MGKGVGMFQPAAGPSYADMEARIAAALAKINELTQALLKISAEVRAINNFLYGPTFKQYEEGESDG